MINCFGLRSHSFLCQPNQEYESGIMPGADQLTNVTAVTVIQCYQYLASRATLRTSEKPGDEANQYHASFTNSKFYEIHILIGMGMKNCLNKLKIPQNYYLTVACLTLYVHSFVHMPPGISCTPELCYISSMVPECFIQEIYNPRTKCNSTANLLVAGRSITVTFYEIDIGDIGKWRSLKCCNLNFGDH